ncbi:MAG: hypothetical protein EHM72_02775, partial [Calditrichaeota bacterium]
MNFNESFKSSLLRLATEGDRWKDDQNIGMEIGFNVLPTLTWLTKTTLLQFQDKQSGYDNDVSSYVFNSGLLYTPWPFLKTKLSLGPKQEN